MKQFSEKINLKKKQEMELLSGTQSAAVRNGRST